MKKLHIIYMVLFSGLVIVSCNKNETKPVPENETGTETETVVDPVSETDNYSGPSTSVSLRGKIGKYPINMHLDIKGRGLEGDVTGYYSYNLPNQEEKHIKIAGKIESNGNFYFNEIADNDSQTTASFSGKKKGKGMGKLSGEYVNLNTGSHKFEAQIFTTTTIG
ncbi:MAG: hypothetical protein IKH02_00635 [Prevotella sp.]|nr:hypothetical protein [Prevotella sp.]